MPSANNEITRGGNIIKSTGATRQPLFPVIISRTIYLSIYLSIYPSIYLSMFVCRFSPLQTAAAAARPAAAERVWPYCGWT